MRPKNKCPYNDREQINYRIAWIDGYFKAVQDAIEYLSEKCEGFYDGKGILGKWGFIEKFEDHLVNNDD